MKKLLPLIFIIPTILFAQKSNFKKLKYHTNHSTPMVMVLKDNVKIGSLEANSFLKENLGLAQNEDLVKVQEHNDKIGQHIKFQQTLGGVEVFGGEYTAHLKNDNVVMYTGHYFNGIPSISPVLSKQDALSKALTYFNADEYIWENEVEIELHKRIKKDPAANQYPDPKLIYFNKSLNLNEFYFELVYEMDIISTLPMSRGEKVMISALTGNVIQVLPLFHDVEREAKGISRFSDTVDIVTEEVSSSLFSLRDASRGGGIETYNAQSTTNTSTPYTDFQHSDTLWDITNSTMDEAAIDAHWGAEKTYDYYLDKHNRDSYDNMGTLMLSFVHYDLNWSNAQWTGDRMQYGDGSVNGNPYLAIDIVGHEISHGVTQWAAGLVYQGESGALYESFSDVFGNAIEYYSDSVRATWYVGEQCSNTLRNMSFPNEFNDPDTYDGGYWAATGGGAADNGGVHTNSGVQNFWYYLLVEGGTGTNDIGNSYNVSAMGWDAASEIAYLNLEDMLTNGSDYEDAREFSFAVAELLYGDCSPEAENVMEAWYAVGVGQRLDGSVNADFLLNYSYTCSLPLSIEFDNLTEGGTSYLWDFGDGSTTLNDTPVHDYNAEGQYDINLTAYLDNGCYLDTGSITRTLNVIEVDTLASASCFSEVTTTVKSIGIDQVILNSLNYQSGTNDDNYNDYTCESNTILHIDSAYDISVFTSPSTRENVKVWLDYNKNQVFEDNELVFTLDNVVSEHTGTLDFAGIGSDVRLNTPIRMRVMSDIFTSKDFTSCEGLKNGQTEDYSVALTDNPEISVSGIFDNIKNSSLSLFPNPTNDVVHIRTSSKEKITSATVLDLLGKKIMTVNSNTVDMSELSNGTYLIEIKTDNNTYSEKIIKN